MKLVLSCFAVLLTNIIFAQNDTVVSSVAPVQSPEDAMQLYRPEYPEGVYLTMESFIKREPTYTKRPIVAKGLIGITKPDLTEIVHQCYFYYITGEDPKITDVFAVSYKGNLYFQMKAVLKYCNKNDRGEETTLPNSFIRVLFGGDNYLYTEANVANGWSIGAMGYAGGNMNSVLDGKGVVWDVKKKLFDVFRNCKDYNEFIKDIKPESVKTCTNKLADLNDVRRDIIAIK